MRISKIKTILGIGLCATLFMSGCSSDSNDDKIVLPSAPSGGIQQPTYQSLELAYNYDLLDSYYFFGHLNNELGADFTEYQNAPLQQTYGSSACTVDFTDICYMYSRMSDRYTRYYDPNYAAIVLKMATETEESTGAGIALDIKTTDDAEEIIVTQVYQNSPAEKAGLRNNDIILDIDGTVPKTLKAAEALLGGKDGEIIKVRLYRDGKEQTIEIQLGTYRMPTVFVSYEDSVPVIRISEFTAFTASDSGTYGEFIAALKKTEGASATIIDLRNNPGGDVDQCNNIASELLSAGDTIITDIEAGTDSLLKDGKWASYQVFDTITYTVLRDGLGKDRYYVFMADSGSASCAEVLLSAVTVNKKSPVVGLTTFGKGIGQFVEPTLANGLGIITAMLSMDKFGQIYHKVGIVPDFESGDPDEQMAKAIEWAKDGSIVRKAGYGTESTGHFAKARAIEPEPTAIPENHKDFLKQVGGKLIFRNIGK